MPSYPFIYPSIYRLVCVCFSVCLFIPPPFILLLSTVFSEKTVMYLPLHYQTTWSRHKSRAGWSKTAVSQNINHAYPWFVNYRQVLGPVQQTSRLYFCQVSQYIHKKVYNRLPKKQHWYFVTFGKTWTKWDVHVVKGCNWSDSSRRAKVNPVYWNLHWISVFPTTTLHVYSARVGPPSKTDLSAWTLLLSCLSSSPFYVETWFVPEMSVNGAHECHWEGCD